MKQAPLSGRYELEEIIGTGGMSVVYRAWDLKYDREVAVKVLRSELMCDEDFIRRFNHEAQAASQMSHAHIVDLFDVGQDGETRYLVMEYVKGVTLKELIRQYGKIRPQRAVQITLSILSAIGHAHENHIVHRDIKPQNILMDADAGVKVGDFGIARVTTAGSVTSIGSKQMMGSVHYFSPEQASGNVADEKSDLYSVGVVLYEMVTGHVPFDGETPISVALKHLNDLPENPSRLNPEVSTGLSEVILKALSKKPEDRYQTAEEMAIDLRRALKMPTGGFIRKQQPGSAHGREKRRKRRRAIAISASVISCVLLAILLGSGLHYYNRLRTRVRMPALELVELEEARAQLEEMGIHCQILTAYDEDVVSGMVISQSPDQGILLFPGATVQLTVSLGKQAVEVPSMIGLLTSEALYDLEERSLVQGEIILQISDAKPGTVIGQEPAAGQRVQPFSEVTLYVSGESAPVPDVLGKTREEAENALRLFGFEEGVVNWAYGDAPQGTVTDQSIKQGSQALLGEPVGLTLSLGAATGLVARQQLLVNVENEQGELVCLLDEGSETRQEIYREQVPQGNHEIALEMQGTEPGEHQLTVYLDGVLVDQKTVVFE